MGNQQTKENDNSQSNTQDKSILFNLIDTIASDMILTQQFQHMKKLDNIDYCNDLVILTSNILNDTFNTQQIEYLNQRIINGITIDEIEKDNIIYIHTNDMNKLGVKNKTKKQRMCIGISKFYIKIAHLFYAIVTTINPEYKYQDDVGNTQSVPFMKQNNLSNDTREKGTITNTGLCYNRINSIILNEIKNVDNKVEQYEVKNNICSMNTKQGIKDGYKIRKTKYLIDEPGIPELKKLYYDVFDYTTNKYIGMSEKSKEQYKNDVKLFYKVFAGKQEVPTDIEHFSDIKLKDFYHHDSCKEGSPMNEIYKVDVNDPIIAKYAKQNAEIIATIERKQKLLIDILEEVFIFQIDKETNKKEIIIHPQLTMTKLDKIVEQARNIIIDLYIGCENDFMRLLQLFETLIEKQIMISTEKKIENIQKEKMNLLSEV